jgi:hypothetical protein
MPPQSVLLFSYYYRYNPSTMPGRAQHLQTCFVTALTNQFQSYRVFVIDSLYTIGKFVLN